MAEALLEHEVLDDPQLDILMRGEKLAPPSKNGRNQADSSPPSDAEEVVATDPIDEDKPADSAEPEETREPSDD